MIRTRVLHYPATGKTWSTRCQGASVTISAGVPGKEKINQKRMADESTAIRWAQKEEWARLKRGYVLVNPQAEPGESRMHFYLGGGYTGAQALADVDGQPLCNRQVPAPNRPRSVAGDDELIVLGPDATVVQQVALPPHRLLWQAVHASALGRVLLRADHQILAWQPRTTTFDTLTVNNSPSASFLAVGGTHGAWYVPPEIVVAGSENGC
jgi:hypothetical protein